MKFVYDGYKLVEELDGLNSDALSHRYVWQDNAVGLDVPVSVYDVAVNKTYFYHADANKNITELTDNTGAVVAHYEYSPFGSLTVQTGAYAAENPFRFSSESFDSEPGLVYCNYRYYDPQLGRWMSRDPIEENGGLNLYGMVENSLLTLWDELGYTEDQYVPDNSGKHGGPHVDRYRGGANVERYNKDGSGILHKGVMLPFFQERYYV